MNLSRGILPRGSKSRPGSPVQQSTAWSPRHGGFPVAVHLTDPGDGEDPDDDEPPGGGAPDGDDGDPSACTLAAPYWSGPSGGFAVRPAPGRASVTATCGATTTEYTAEDGLVTGLVSGSCPGGLRITGAAPGGWYWQHGERNAAAVPFGPVLGQSCPPTWRLSPRRRAAQLRTLAVPCTALQPPRPLTAPIASSPT